MTLALEVQNLSIDVKPHFWSKRRRLLRDVAFSLPKGRIFGFLGPNGAGKTTTLRAVLGLMPAPDGAIRILGGDIRDPAIRARIGYMPERPYFPGHLSGFELVSMHAALAGIPYTKRASRCQKLIEEVGMSQDAHRRLRHYSKGMLQRVGMAQALIADPDLLILDEPLSGLDPAGRRDLRTIIARMGHLGKTVIFSTHILSDVEEVADEIGILVSGKMVERGNIHAILSQEKQAWTLTASTSQLPDPPKNLLECSKISAAKELSCIECSNLETANLWIDFLRHSNIGVQSLSPAAQSLEDVLMKHLPSPQI